MFINTLPVTLTSKRKGFIITLQYSLIQYIILRSPTLSPLTHTHSVAKDIKYGVWFPETGVYGDIDGGFPLVVLDSTMDNTVVLSPMNSFMSANQITFTDDQTGDKVLTFGPISSVNEVIMRESNTPLTVG